MLNFSLIPDWKIVLTKAWSLKWWGLATLLSFGEAVAATLGDSIAKQWPAGAYAALVAALGALGLFTRLMAQKEITTVINEEPTK